MHGIKDGLGTGSHHKDVHRLKKWAIEPRTFFILNPDPMRFVNCPLLCYVMQIPTAEEDKMTSSSETDPLVQ